MSRIGNKLIAVPAGVKVNLSGRTVTIEGPQGKLSLTHRPEVKVTWSQDEKAIRVAAEDAFKDHPDTSKYWGSTRAHLRNMVEGVTKGYEKTLEVVGVGWTATIAGRSLQLVVGFANKITMPIPDGLKVTVDKAFVKIQGPDKGLVGRFAADVRAQRKPEPYNGKGIKYTTEVVRRKQGKQFGA